MINVINKIKMMVFRFFMWNIPIINPTQKERIEYHMSMYLGFYTELNDIQMWLLENFNSGGHSICRVDERQVGKSLFLCCYLLDHALQFPPEDGHLNIFISSLNYQASLLMLSKITDLCEVISLKVRKNHRRGIETDRFTLKISTSRNYDNLMKEMLGIRNIMYVLDENSEDDFEPVSTEDGKFTPFTFDVFPIPLKVVCVY